MSVLACDRKGCENVMCDRLSSNFGYICSDCLTEMSRTIPLITFKLIERFMESKVERLNIPSKKQTFRNTEDEAESILSSLECEFIDRSEMHNA